MAKSKITLGQVDPVGLACQTALGVAQQYGLRLKLREILRGLEPHAADLEAEKARLVDEFAEKDADGKPIQDGDRFRFGEHEPEVNRRWDDLRSATVTISHSLKFEDVAGLPADPALDGLELLLG